MSKTPQNEETSRIRYRKVVRSRPQHSRYRTRALMASSLGLVVGLALALVTMSHHGDGGRAVAGDHCQPTLLRVGVATPVAAPWFDGDPADGSGFESALIKELIRQLGIPASHVTYVAAPAEQVLGGHGARGWDIAVSQYRDPGAVQGVRFSRGYLGVPQALVTIQRDLRPKRVADLSGTRLAVVSGSAGEAVAARSKRTGPAPSAYPGLGALGQALRSGRERTVVVDLPDAAALVRSTPHARMIGLVRSLRSPSELRVVVPEGSPFLRCVDQGLADLQSAGTLEALERQWLRGRWGARMLD